MKKTTKQILKNVAKYGAVYGLGVLTVVALWRATYVPPEGRLYSLTVLYKIDTGHGFEMGDETGKAETQALAYLYEPFYRFHRHRGVSLLEQQAAKGLVNSMGELARYYASINDDERFLYWARKAAEKGRYGALTLGLLGHYPALSEEDLALLEQAGREHEGVAAALSRYYSGYMDGTIYDAGKAEFWKKYYVENNTFWPRPNEVTPVLKEISLR